ncbi:hypothetical protein P7C73_g3116, partial [Tremellales sp. Uapishka_1]
MSSNTEFSLPIRSRPPGDPILPLNGPSVTGETHVSRSMLSRKSLLLDGGLLSSDITTTSRFPPSSEADLASERLSTKSTTRPISKRGISSRVLGSHQDKRVHRAASSSSSEQPRSSKKQNTGSGENFESSVQDPSEGLEGQASEYDAGEDTDFEDEDPKAMDHIGSKGYRTATYTASTSGGV